VDAFGTWRVIAPSPGDGEHVGDQGALAVAAKDGQSATGTILSISPTLAPVSDKPKTALICTSPKQSLSVTLQTDASASATRSAGPMQLDPAAKPVAQIFR